jgi:transposase-like protein
MVQLRAVDHPAEARRRWVELYAQCGDAGQVCRRCGISRPTLRKWWRRYRVSGADGLVARSRRPHGSPAAKLDAEMEALILDLRKGRRLGPKLIQAELLRLHERRLSTATIGKALHRAEVPTLRPRRHHAAPSASMPSSSAPIPPRSPHLNGKVERSQHTDWVEF